MMLKIDEIQKTILTHILVPVGPMPTVLDPNGVYPYQSFCETSARPVLKQYGFVVLENDFLRVLICPDLGGKVYSIHYKSSGKEALYVPEVIRQSRILPRFSFVAGGIEVSFPISHTPSQNEKVCHETVEEKDRIYVLVGEKEIRYGMQWTVEYSLGAHDQFLTQRNVFYNPTTKAHPWMSWSNAALPAFEDSEFHFPTGEVLVHSDKLTSIDWVKEGPKTNADIKNMTGYFWKNSDCNAFGCFSPSHQIGLYHVADKSSVPGMKLWSYGMHRDLDWSFLSSLSKQSYLEIQAGPIADQSIKKQLDPGEMHQHIEYWMPSHTPIAIGQISIPEVALRPLSSVTLFPFSREREVQIWNTVLDAYHSRDISQIPAPPVMHEACWAPSGLPNLNSAFQWIIDKDLESNTPLWYMYYGVWLIANDLIDVSIPALRASGLDMAHAMLGRVYAHQGKYDNALICFDKMVDAALALHPQLVVERDMVLEKMGDKTYEERKRSLDKLDALNDDTLTERRIDLLIAMECFDEAKELLLKTNFQKVHQRYERKKLWEKLCKLTNDNIEPYPDNLGEDHLAQFGAYREYEA